MNNHGGKALAGANHPDTMELATTRDLPGQPVNVPARPVARSLRTTLVSGRATPSGETHELPGTTRRHSVGAVTGWRKGPHQSPGASGPAGPAPTEQDLRALAGELDSLPLLAPARDHLAQALRARRAKPGDVVLAIESDLGLTIRTMRLANRGRSKGRVASVPQAVRVLGANRLSALAECARSVDMLAGPGSSTRGETARLHALAVHRAADRLCELIDLEPRDEVLAAALLHDIGKLALPEVDESPARSTPETRLRAERRRYGTDHCRLGATLAGMLNFPDSLIETIAGHHDAAAPGRAALLRLADMLAHYGQGASIDLECAIALSETLGASREALSKLMYELPTPLPIPPRAIEPCPLSHREREVLERLAQGKVYKQIGHELELSASTIRSHLHRIYRRLGAADRTQAVMVASAHGWI